MKTAFSILFLFVALTCSAQMPFIQGMMAQSQAAGGPIFSEAFEGSNSGFDNANWTRSGSPTPDPDFTFIVLEGSHSLFCTNGAYAYSPSFAAQDTAWVYFRFMVTNQTANVTFLRFYTTSHGSVLGSVALSSGRLDVYQGTADGVTVGTISANTMYYGCYRYTKETTEGAADGVASIEFSTTTTQAGSGNNFKSIPNGTSVGQIAEVTVLGSVSMGVVIDNIKVFTSSQGAMQ